MLTRINNLFSKHNILTECQYGFRKGKAEDTALFTQKEMIVHNFDDHKLTLGIFIDYTKAFDYLNHNRFLGKLQAYGIRDVALSVIPLSSGTVCFSRESLIIFQNNLFRCASR